MATRAMDRALAYDVERVRRDFPVLSRTAHGKPLVYLDNAATSQKPRVVIDAIRDYYERYNSNVHRGVHTLSEEATQAFEAARAKARAFVNAERAEEIVFVRGTTEAINLVAATHGRTRVHAGDEVVISAMEHHSNIVPWQMLCDEKSARLRVIPMNDRGELDLVAYEKLLGPRTKIVALAYVANSIGTINPLREMARAAHAHGATVVVDAAQAAPHLAIDVRALDADFLALSSHKMYGPMGIGILYGKYALLDAMPPYQGGGDMILSVTFEKTTYNHVPHKFEAGTPNVADAIGFGAAIDYVTGLGLEAIAAYEHELLEYGTQALSAIPGLRLVGTARDKATILSFLVDGIHPHDLGTILDREGIAVRTGHHCAQPVMDRFGVPATARASLGLYNTKAEIDALAAGIRRAVEVFR
ncbi:MAG TPA: cysteine desulfurase [Candidatus Eisenbacteria bacterium]|nr:cysteine desulfurase [Candidatus Eisenbacteria bacterium]